MNSLRLARALIAGCFALLAAGAPASAQTTAAAPPPASAGPVDPALLEDLVTANHVLARHGVLDAFGHVSVRHPSDPHHFLMSRSLAPALVTGDDILELTVDGESCDARGRQPFIERHLHAGIYRKQVNWVLDADIQGFLDSASYCPLVHEV